MAGGMHRRGSGVPLSARVRPGQAAEVASRPPASFEAREDDCPARHCWVADPADGSGAKRPGLLVEWRGTPEGWQGRVVYAARVRPATWALVEEWLPADRLTPR